jgi:hypothetical protein
LLVAVCFSPSNSSQKEAESQKHKQTKNFLSD